MQDFGVLSPLPQTYSSELEAQAAIVFLVITTSDYLALLISNPKTLQEERGLAKSQCDREFYTPVAQELHSN